jgi:hypothetical protein
MSGNLQILGMHTSWIPKYSAQRKTFTVHTFNSMFLNDKYSLYSMQDVLEERERKRKRKIKETCKKLKMHATNFEYLGQRLFQA